MRALVEVVVAWADAPEQLVERRRLLAGEDFLVRLCNEAADPQ